MIYISVQAVKSEGRGYAEGNGWHDTDDVVEAVAREMTRFHAMWDHLGHGTVVTYNITVAPESSPLRTIGGNAWPLPVVLAKSDDQRESGGEA